MVDLQDNRGLALSPPKRTDSNEKQTPSPH